MAATDAGDFNPLRWAIFAGGCVLVLLAVSGVLTSTMFTAPNTIKYLVTVAGSVLVTLVAISRAPMHLLVGAAIIVAPFDFVTTFDSIPVTPVLAIVVLALLVWMGRSRTPGMSALRLMPALFVLLLLPAIVGSDTPADWALWLAVTVATGCLAFLVACSPGGPAFIAGALAVSAVIQAGIAIWEHRTGQHLNLYQAPGSASYGSAYFFTYGSYKRPPGALPDPIGLGQVLALCIPMMVALAVGVRRWSTSLAVVAAAGVAAIALLLSLSRMSIVGGVVGAAVVVVLLPRRALLSRAPGIAAMVVLVVVLGFSFGGKTLTQRLDSILHPTTAHLSTAPGDLARERIWRAALKTAEATPITGVGFGNVTKELPKHGVPVTSSAHAHNTYLQYFAEGGVLGLLALLGVIGAAAFDLVRAFAAQRIWVAGAAGALVATLLSWLTDVEVRYVQVSAMVAVLLGLIAALAVRDPNHSRPSSV